MSDYRRAWWDGEADAYERRNPNATGLQPRVLDAIAREVNPGDSILEVGCGSGANLRGIETRIRGRIACFGCDPSEIALENGRAKAPEHEFHRATSDALPYADSSFDLVLLSFVLHWVDPVLLLQTVAEVDRVLRDWDGKRPGILAIADFAPNSPHSRPYGHHRGLKTWKMDFSALWSAHPGYTCILSHVFDETAEENERRRLSVLAKNLAAGFPERTV